MYLYMIEHNLIVAGSLLGAGAAGALVKEILAEGFLKMPELKDGKLMLGFLSSVIVGAAVGYLVDHNFLMAFFAGYTGFSAVSALTPKIFLQPETVLAAVTPNAPAQPVAPVLPPDSHILTIQEIIKKATDKFGVNYNLALAVARCESGLNPHARNINPAGSTDRGLYQINDKWHPDVSTEQADDPVFAAEWFCKAVLAGNLSWWNASKKCWGIVASP